MSRLDSLSLDDVMFDDADDTDTSSDTAGHPWVLRHTLDVAFGSPPTPESSHHFRCVSVTSNVVLETRGSAGLRATSRG